MNVEFQLIQNCFSSILFVDVDAEFVRLNGAEGKILNESY